MEWRTFLSDVCMSLGMEVCGQLPRMVSDGCSVGWVTWSHKLSGSYF